MRIRAMRFQIGGAAWVALAIVLFGGAAGLDAEGFVSASGWPGVVVSEQGTFISAREPGRVASIPVAIGDNVVTGATLVVLDREEMRRRLDGAEAALRAAESERERLSLRASRYDERVTRLERVTDLVSEEELGDSRTEAAEAAAELESASATVVERSSEVKRLRRAVSEAELRAPFGGTVAVRFVEIGTVVSSGQPILQLVSSEKKLLRFAVSPQEVDVLSVGSPVQVAVESLEVQAKARVVSISPHIDLASQMVFVEARFEAGAPTLRIGQGVWVRRE